MVHFLIYRPIAVLISTLALVGLSLVTFQKIPVSLLPDIDIPEITVQVSYPSAAARELQQAVVWPLKNQLQQVTHLADIEAITQDGFGILKLHFDYGTNINLAYLETNEKIDALVSSLPRDMERPKVIKAGAGDIAVFNLNVAPNGVPSQPPEGESKFNNSSSGGWGAGLLTLSDFCENVLKRRIEQLPEVALVDMTGLAKPEMVILPDRNKMLSLGLTEQQLAQTLQANNVDLGNVTVKDGQYQYNIKFGTVLRTQQDIENIYFKTSPQNGRLLQLKDIATIELREQKQKGLYTFNGQRAVCLAIIKQSDTQLLRLRQELQKLTTAFEKDYPDLRFSISQDQTELLDLSINNLTSNILTGALLTFVMIFFFLNNRKIPFLIGAVIPVSLVVTFLCFFLFGISINIVSLAGLVLGIGEIIDSAIIIVENIEDKRAEGLPLDQACIEGTEEVIGPLFTSVLTNSAVFLPLIFLSGIAGALFFDQALSVTLALAVSLLTSYTLVPVLYRLIFRKEEKKQGYIAKPETWVALRAEAAYNGFFYWSFKYKTATIVIFSALVLAGIGAFWQIEKRGMPAISRTELQAHIDWNVPINVTENNRRVALLTQGLRTPTQYVSGFVGQQQFLLNRDLQQNFNEVRLSLKVANDAIYQQLTNEISEKTKRLFPAAVLSFSPAKNIFEQLFSTSDAPLQVRLSSNKNNVIPNFESIEQANIALAKLGLSQTLPPQQQQFSINIAADKLLLYEVPFERVQGALKTVFNENNLGNLKAEQKYVPIVLGGREGQTESILNETNVLNRQNQNVSLRQLIDIQPQNDYKVLYAGRAGYFIPFDFDVKNVVQTQVRVREVLKNIPDLSVSFAGSFFKNQAIINELGLVFVVALALLFFILAAQFESLTQPLIVMLTILLGLSGAVVLLFVAHDSLNIMSVIGMVVLIGILDNDSILKIDTMNRSDVQLSLTETIRLAGKKRLKSQLMTFLTTVLGVLPVVFSGGLGAELQRPLALAIMGGMTLGLITSTMLLPLVYWWLGRNTKFSQ
jgi:multidrug efflux pump subunit AcrB